MAETIIKYNVPKDSKRDGSTYISSHSIYGDSVTSSGSTTNITGNTMWQTSQGKGSLIPSGSNNIAQGNNSVAIGSNTQTTNEGELAIGEYNKSIEGVTLFSVGDGTSEEDRHNVFEVDYSGFTATNGNIEGTLQAANSIFESAKVNGLLDANQLQAISGYIQSLLAEEITTDYLTVTKAAHFFKLIIDEIKASQGAVIITPANAVLDKVDTISGGWRCWYRAKDEHDKQIYNSFEVNDQVICQTFDAATGTSYNVSNQFYWRKVTATGTTSTTISGKTVEAHYFDLSSTDCASNSLTPRVGDNCVQLGNRTDTTRQAAIIISAYNNQYLDSGISAPSIVQYQGINDYNLSNHRLNVISQGFNEFRGGYYNNNGKNIETLISETATTLDGKITTLNGTVTSHTQSISNLQQTDTEIKSTVSANTTSIGNLSDRLNTVSGNVSANTTNIATLQQTASGLTSTVSSHSTSISTLSSNVSSVSSSVSTLSNNVSSVSGSVSTLSNNVNSVSGNVNSLSSDINSLSGNVNSLSSNLNTLSGTVSTNTTNIATLQQTATGLTSIVNSHTSSISTLTSNVSSVSDNVSILSNNVSSVSGSVSSLSNDVSSVSGSVSTLSNNVNSVSGSVSNLSNDVSNVSGKVNTLSGTVTTNTSNISTLQQTANGLSSTVSSHTTSIYTLNSNVSSVSGTVSSLSSTVSTNTSNISTLRQTTSGLSSTVSSHTTKINSISGTVTSHTQSISNLSNSASTNANNISSMQTQINQLPDNITLSASRVNVGGNKTLDSMLTVSSSNITMTTQEVIINGPNTKGIVRMKNANDNEVITLNTNSTYPTVTVRTSNNASYSTIDPTQIETTNGTLKARLLTTSTPKLRLQNGNYYFEIELDSSGRVWMGGNCSFPNSSQQKSKYLFRNSDDYIEWSS